MSLVTSALSLITYTNFICNERVLDVLCVCEPEEDIHRGFFKPAVYCSTLNLTLRLLMSYIYGAPVLDVSRSHMTTHHSR